MMERYFQAMLVLVLHLVFTKDGKFAEGGRCLSEPDNGPKGEGYPECDVGRTVNVPPP
jgi:hypothetical protein